MAEEAAIGRHLDWSRQPVETAENRNALDRAFERLRPRLERLVAGLGFCAADREDLLQESYVRAVRGLASLRSAERIEGWLVRIAVNVARAEFRRRKRFADHVQETADRAQPREAGCETDNARAVREALRKLPPDQISVLVLRYYCDYTAPEIGRLLEMNANTVRYRLAQARTALAQALKPDFGEME